MKMLDTEFVIVCGHRGTRFHEVYQSRTGRWRTICGTGFDVERLLSRDAAEADGFEPCRRCYEEES